MSDLKNILINKKKNCKTIWFMRQAGRHLPEFRKIRSKNKNFIKLCLNSKLSSEITLQPIKRYNLDSAIIFSDILMVPFALGQNVNFIKNKGPVLSKFDIKKFSKVKEKEFTQKLRPIYKAIKITRKKLNKKKSLISFVGSPWTLLVYMLSLKNKKGKINIKLLNIKNNQIKKIMDNLNKFLCIHIKNQFNAGADVVQIFDSWAGKLPNNKLKQFCFKPNKRIVDFCKKHKFPTICFPKGINKNYLNFNNYVKPNCLNLDYDLNPTWAKKNLKNVVLQGGMNPKTLLKSDKFIFREAKKYLDVFENVPYIFNLGHGVIPETSPKKIEKLIKFVRNY
tara:strand:- start:1250 stop:2257 length:1008 start_codon:yes stop_codon:yes gene_type:complete